MTSPTIEAPNLRRSRPNSTLSCGGAGFSGLSMLHRLRDSLGLNVRVVEVGDGKGGSGYWNRSPALRPTDTAGLHSSH